MTDSDGTLVLGLSGLPGSYAVRIQPQVLADDEARRPTLTNADGDTVIDEISDWVNPELAAATAGAADTVVSDGGSEAGTGVTDFTPYGSALRFLTWSLEPGVIFEITTWNRDRTLDELIQLAEATSTLEAAEWHQIYD